MANTKIDVNLNLLGTNIESMNDMLTAIEGNMKNISSDVDTMSSMWDGPAHDAFMKTFGTDEKTFNELKKTLKEYVDSLENAKQIYLKYEAIITEIINSMK